MAEKKKYSNNEKIKCPFCGRTGTVMMSHSYLSVVHRTERREITSPHTGNKYKAEILVDGCSKLGKMGILK